MSFSDECEIFHALQGIGSKQSLISHPKLGASWEGFALEQILKKLHAEEAYFYAVHGGAVLIFICRIAEWVWKSKGRMPRVRAAPWKS